MMQRLLKLVDATCVIVGRAQKPARWRRRTLQVASQDFRTGAAELLPAAVKLDVD